MGLAYVVVTIAAAAFAGRAVRSPYADGDLFWQKHLGAYVLAHGSLPTALGPETFTAQGAPWTPQEWLLGIVAALAIGHGLLWLLSLAAGLALGLAVLISAYRARGFGVLPLATAICAALLAVDLEGSFGVRAQVFAWPLLCALLWVLDRKGARVFWAVPIVAVWANLHASAMLAIPIVWLEALVTRTRERAILACAVPFAVLLTPLGIRLPQYAFFLLNSPIRGSIDEWQHISWHNDFFWYGGAPMAILVAIAARTLWRERPRDTVLAAVLLVMTIAAIRNGALFGFVAMPLAARAVDVVTARLRWWPQDPLRSAGPRMLAYAGGALTALAVFALTLRTPPNKGAWMAPVATFDLVASLGGEHRVFCFDFAVCSVALDYPNLRVFMDGRADPYPLWVWDDFNLIRFGKPGWERTLNEQHVDVVISKRDDPLDRAIRVRPEWKRLPKEDRCCYAYVR